MAVRQTSDEPAFAATQEVAGPLDEVPPFALFGGLSDDAWRWLNLEGREDCTFLARYLPGLTGDPEFEAHAVGMSGKQALGEAFAIYELLKRLCEEHGEPLNPSSRVLDFGCGWGRVIRCFLKDVAPENLIGIDANEERLAAASTMDCWCQFERCKPWPPTRFETASFDLAYSTFVFSHLSEEAHQHWLVEFGRLLKPGAVLIVTTYSRSVLERSAHPDSAIAGRFVPLEHWLSEYDRGAFCHRTEPGYPARFGTTFIPEGYVREHWSKQFVVQDYFDAPAWGQSVVVCSKPDSTTT